MPKKTQDGFEMLISASVDGVIQAVYITLHDAKSVRTSEIIENRLLADYDSTGRVIGIEILGPVKITRVTQLVDRPIRQQLRRFVKEQAPEDLVLA